MDEGVRAVDQCRVPGAAGAAAQCRAPAPPLRIQRPCRRKGAVHRGRRATGG